MLCLSHSEKWLADLRDTAMPLREAFTKQTSHQEKRTGNLTWKFNRSVWLHNLLDLLKASDDGFYIAEEDMKLRGYGDIIGFKQSGIKLFKIADPVHHEDLFKLAEKNINNLSDKELNHSKYNILLKLFDKVDLINEEGTSS